MASSVVQPRKGPGDRGRGERVDEAKRLLGCKILGIKKRENLTWSDIATHVEDAPVSACAACLGHKAMLPAAAERLGALLGLTREEVALLQRPPSHANSGAAAPIGPLLYRFHEFVTTYGTAWEEVLREECGQGSLTAFDVDVRLEPEPDAAGHRMELCFKSTFLPRRRA